MPRLSFSERLASAAFGLCIGALIGVVLAWLLGVYSHTLGPATSDFSVFKLVSLTSLFFGVIGLLFGTSVGSALGTTIALILETERQSSNPELPRWLVVSVLALVVAAVWWHFA